jgi:hypothetical protein
VAVRAAELAEVLILPAHDEFVYPDLGTIAEFDSEVGVGPFVEPIAGIFGLHGGQRHLMGRG